MHTGVPARVHGQCQVLRRTVGTTGRPRVELLVPQLYPRGLGALRGKHPSGREAADAAELAWGSRPGLLGVTPRWSGRLVGSRRGAGWQGLFLLDPVDGQGRRPQTDLSTRLSSAYHGPGLDHWRWGRRRSAPRWEQPRAVRPGDPTGGAHRGARPGHADMLQGRSRSLGRRLCGEATSRMPHGRCARACWRTSWPGGAGVGRARRVPPSALIGCDVVVAVCAGLRRFVATGALKGQQRRNRASRVPTTSQTGINVSGEPSTLLLVTARRRWWIPSVIYALIALLVGLGVASATNGLFALSVDTKQNSAGGGGAGFGADTAR